MAKWVYSFGSTADGRGGAEGRADMRNLLGGKGANLAEMASLALTTHRVDRRMLQQQEHIVHAAFEPQCRYLGLEPQTIVVSHPTEKEVLNHRCVDCSQLSCGFFWARLFFKPRRKQPCENHSMFPGNQEPQKCRKRPRPNTARVHQEVKRKDVEEHRT